MRGTVSYNLVIFDLDGTLIDSAEGICHAVMETIETLGYDSLSEEFIRECIGPPIADSIGSKVGYTKKQIDDFYSVFRPLYKEKYLFECSVYPGIFDLLSDLKKGGKKLAIATNKRTDYATVLLEKIGLLDYFDTVKAMDMDGRSKKKDLVKGCIDEFPGIGDTVMIGDSMNDYESAIANNIDFIGVRYGFGLKNGNDQKMMMANTIEHLRDLLV